MGNYSEKGVCVLENWGKMVETVLEIGIRYSMNDLAGRLNEMARCLFSLFMHGKGYHNNML